jgi:hypothetical protein
MPKTMLCMQEVPTPEMVAARVLQNAVGASETTASTLLGTMFAIALVPEVMVGAAGVLGQYVG